MLGDALGKVLVAHASVALARVAIGAAVDGAIGEEGEAVTGSLGVASGVAVFI